MLIEVREQELKSRYLTEVDAKIGWESATYTRGFRMTETLSIRGLSEKMSGGMTHSLLYDKSIFLNISRPKNALESTTSISL
jgi:hypothetical protein